MLQRSEQNMSKNATDWLAAGEIQHVDEIIPTRVCIHGVLVGDKRRCMVAVILVDASQFEGAIAKRCNTCLNGDDSTSRCKGAIVE